MLIVIVVTFYIMSFWLVVWNIVYFFHMLGIIILANSYFSEGWRKTSEWYFIGVGLFWWYLRWNRSFCTADSATVGPSRRCLDVFVYGASGAVGWPSCRKCSPLGIVKSATWNLDLWLWKKCGNLSEISDKMWWLHLIERNIWQNWVWLARGLLQLTDNTFGVGLTPSGPPNGLSLTWRCCLLTTLPVHGSTSTSIFIWYVLVGFLHARRNFMFGIHFPHPKYVFKCANLTIYCSRIGRRIGSIISFGPLSKLWGGYPLVN